MKTEIVEQVIEAGEIGNCNWCSCTSLPVYQRSNSFPSEPSELVKLVNRVTVN